MKVNSLQGYSKKKAIESLRLLGNKLFNEKNNVDNPSSNADNSMMLTRKRKYINEKVKNSLRQCRVCDNWFSKTNLSRHLKHCVGDTEPQPHQLSKRLELLFQRGNKDLIHGEMMKDKLIIQYGREELCMTDKYDSKVRNSVRGKMRTIMKILLEMKKKCPKIKNLSSIFDKIYRNAFKEAVLKTAGYDPRDKTYTTPSIALNSGYLFSRCAEILHFNLMQNDGIIKRVKEWKKCYKRQYHIYIYKNAERALSLKNHRAIQQSPLQNDIKRLYTNLREVMKSKANKLKEEGFTMNSWETLGSALLTFILFNRHRVGEMERFKN